MFLSHINFYWSWGTIPRMYLFSDIYFLHVPFLSLLHHVRYLYRRPFKLSLIFLRREAYTNKTFSVLTSRVYFKDISNLSSKLATRYLWDIWCATMGDLFAACFYFILSKWATSDVLTWSIAVNHTYPEVADNVLLLLSGAS